MKQTILKVGNVIKIKNLPHYLIPKIREHLIIENPKWLENEKHKRSNFKTPKKLRFISEDSKTIPRGFLKQLIKILKEANVDYRIRRNAPSYPIKITSSISFESRPYGEKAVAKILKKKSGVLEAPTGSGKTVIAIEAISRRKEKTLIVVHTKELQDQWIKRLETFTNLREENKGDIGRIGGGGKAFEGLVTIGIINSLRNMTDKNPDQFNKSFGFVIVDECHRVPSNTFSKFMIHLNVLYILGLSATPFRTDGLDKVINFFMGEVVYKIKTKKLQKDGHILKANLNIIKTAFSPQISYSDNETEKSWQTKGSKYQKAIKQLITDHDRNSLILKNLTKQLREKKGIPLIISDRTEHCFTLFNMIPKHYSPIILTGTIPKKKRTEAIEKLNNGEAGAVVATSQLVGEGLDQPKLSSIFLTTPISGREEKMMRLIQVIGRVLRIAEGKEDATIFDFNDPCWILRGSYNKRLKAYKEMGIIK